VVVGPGQAQLKRSSSLGKAQPAVVVRSLVKDHGDVKAVKGVDFEVAPGGI